VASYRRFYFPGLAKISFAPPDRVCILFSFVLSIPSFSSPHNFTLLAPTPFSPTRTITNTAKTHAHSAWINANPDKLMVVKFYAPWCRACKAVEPKFLQISKDPKYADIPIVWGQLSVQHNKAYVKSLGIMALPSIQIYAGSEGLVENFPCGPSKVPMLRRKITETINDKIDPSTLTLKYTDCANPENAESMPCRTRSLAVLEDSGEANSSEIDEVITDQRKEENLRYLRTGVPYFKDFDDDEFYNLMDKVRAYLYIVGA
jgi:thiol-disulfide isomerase/thioredoxin